MPEPEGIIVKIRANIELLSHKDGGRESGIYKGYRSMIGIWGAVYEGAVDEIDGKSVEPGGAALVEVRILFSSGKAIIREVTQGMRFNMQEGTRVIGSGVVMDILEVRGIDAIS